MVERSPDSRSNGKGKGASSLPPLEDRLRKHPFAAGMPAAAIEILASVARPCNFISGQYLWKQGAHADALHLIDSGQIALEILIPQQGPLRIETIAEGGVIGWSWLVPPFRWQFDARAISDGEALVLDGKRMRELCDREPGIGYEVLKRLTIVLGVRLQAARLRILELYQQ